MAECAKSPHTSWSGRLELMQAGWLAANLLWTTLCLGGYRPETMVITSALTGILLVVHLLRRLVAPDGGVRLHPAGWYFLPFLAYAAANVIWVTPVRWLGWHDWLWWAQLLAIFWVVLNDLRGVAARRLLLFALVLTGFVSVALAGYQFLVRPDWLMMGRQQVDQFIGRSTGPFGIPNSLAGLLLLLLPPVAALLLRRRATAMERVLSGYLVAVFAWGLILTASRGAWLGLALAVAVWPLLAGRRSWRRRMGQVLAVSLIIVAVGTTIYLAAPKMRARFDALVQDAGEKTRPIMWRGAWQLFRENPVWGSGAGSYNVLFEKHRPESYQLDSQWAHNDYLNTLSDYGAVGFGLFFGAVALVGTLGVRYARKQLAHRAGTQEWQDDPWLRQAMALGLLAFGLQLFVDFHLKIPALAMALAIMSGLLIPAAWPLPMRTAGRTTWGTRLALGAGVLAVMVGLILWVLPHYRAEALRYASRQALDKLEGVDLENYRPTLQPARARLVSAVAMDPANAQAWSDLAYVTELWAHVEPQLTKKLGVEAERQADRALAESKAVPEFWIRRAVSLDMQGRWLEAGDSLVEAMQLAPASTILWYHQAYHLSLNPVAVAQAKAAAAISLRLDPGNRAAHLLRQQLATGQ
ncbi:MAG: O-antigen ligase family protein [Opitutaceae bacterium]|nr:O-antigen ligase family protein [Opitutaceae bacterium]MBP9912612.1 O-antigen ligase family protein [Opitutaceae bacterium]